MEKKKLDMKIKIVLGIIIFVVVFYVFVEMIDVFLFFIVYFFFSRCPQCSRPDPAFPAHGATVRHWRCALRRCGARRGRSAPRRLTPAR